MTPTPTPTDAGAPARRVSVVTGAGSGIGAATARALAAAGHHVVLTGRRAELLERVAKEIRAADGTAASGGSAEVYPLDITDAAAVRAFAEHVGPVDDLVNNAGGAVGAESVADADPADWRAMYEVNVLGTLRLTQALLPALEASGRGTVLVLSSTAAFTAYEGGGGYVAAKAGAHALAATLRLELCGRPVRVVEIAPGMVRTDEFAVNRFRGDEAKAAAVYQGVAEPLLAEDVADTVVWSLTRPPHVNVDLLVVRPRAQAAQHKIHREA
ncbi:SDR family NAD(P)-dependent oxidoreductase [Streptomyces sp. NPDC086023]|uniref:SDR family NAD(P)-dependent oxidoreductase n=1 Tax=Streptomyces sp. NPDC086023 TaxID=3365746 RepID=UPI0037D35239